MRIVRAVLALALVGGCGTRVVSVGTTAPPTTSTVPAARIAIDSMAGADYRRLEREIFEELNAARTNPAAYAARVNQLLAEFEGTLLHDAGYKLPVRTTEGAAAVREAVSALRAQHAESPLTFNAALSEAAMDLAADQSKSGKTGHEASDGSNPEIRIARHGRWLGSFSENVAYGSFRSGRATVVELLVDDGVPNRGHRKNIFDPNASVAGIACAPHPRYDIVCVIDQTAGYSAR